jgi:hypothetical protein
MSVMVGGTVSVGVRVGVWVGKVIGVSVTDGEVVAEGSGLAVLVGEIVGVVGIIRLNPPHAMRNKASVDIPINVFCKLIVDDSNPREFAALRA